ncbi:Site-specific recombinase [Methanosarcina siciliae C2J]|uniref:Site-specific recombinase n=1 Tax=Methanosarcina siciliae C2J TaxID=1434118 RepID=A0A0E3LCH8_9EURY|nr:tyrosine-type recombinase/integrase [Methanosarcina siciliae]AKB35546.1 Site-specific recombinase [Methanosarcina siciliae C2J]
MDMLDVLSVEFTSEIDLLDSFLCDCQVRNFSPRTIASYKSHVQYFLNFYNIHASVNDLKDFLVHIRDERGLSASTVENYFCSLSTFYEFLVWERVVKENTIPAFRKRYIRYYKEPRSEERQLISLKQMKNLIDSAGDLQTKVMFLVFAKTGIRRQELIDLDRSDIYPKKNMIVLKNHHFKRSNGTVFYDDECSFYLEKWIKWRYNHNINNPALFIGSQGGRISRDRVYTVTTEHAEKLGFHDSAGKLEEKFTPHCFRHFFTTWIRRAGCPREYVQELRGDSRKEAIDIYHHITHDELREAYMKYVPQLGIKM